jgi:hypothetical protein
MDDDKGVAFAQCGRLPFFYLAFFVRCWLRSIGYDERSILVELLLAEPSCENLSYDGNPDPADSTR